MSFLPTNYQAVPKSGGNYLKLQEGTNRIRILTDAITGWLYWVPNPDKPGTNKPVRIKEMPEVVPAEAVADKFGGFIKHFWAFGVYNYQDDAVQIMEITQATIQDAIFAIHSDEDWGDPKQYDIKIVKSKEGDKIKYHVSPAPKSELSLKIANAFAEKPINLEALYDGADPFDPEYVNTKGM